MDEQTYMTELSKMDRPVPGMSLTNDPDNPAPYEQPPKFTNVHEASQFMWEKLTSDETYASVMTGISKGVPVMPIVQIVLFDEFQKGSFNPDLMMMLIEPTAYMIIALAERLDLNIKVDTDDDEDEGEEKVFGVSMQEQKLEQLREAAGPSKKVPEGLLTVDQINEMKNLPELPSLFEKPKIQTEPEPNVAEEPIQEPSLMAPTEGQ
jgi:hypothetical protein